MAGVLFEDIFNVKDIDPEGKKFDRGESIFKFMLWFVRGSLYRGSTRAIFTAKMAVFCELVDLADSAGIDEHMAWQLTMSVFDLQSPDDETSSASLSRPTRQLQRWSIKASIPRVVSMFSIDTREPVLVADYSNAETITPKNKQTIIKLDRFFKKNRNSQFYFLDMKTLKYVRAMLSLT